MLNVAQRLATHGETMATQFVEDFDTFEAFYDRYRTLVRTIIVDKDNFILNNDILNAVTCNVVTLDVEINGDTGEHNFIPYEPEQEI